MACLCLQLSGRRAYIRYDRDDSSFWFNPVVNDDPRHLSASGSEFPCSRGDIFLKLGMRGARLIPWQLKEGDVFRLGQARRPAALGQRFVRPLCCLTTVALTPPSLCPSRPMCW